MAGTLSIVATPIGHLEDITLRALSVLRSANLIAAEDTRRTAKLLAHFGIRTRTLSFHEHNTRTRLPTLLSHLDSGESVALVSDAGTPILSDPGLELVQACIAKGIPVDAIPGASAPLTLAVLSGFPFSPWTIYGFPPTRSSDRKHWFSAVTAIQHSVSFLESPHRIVKSLQELAGYSPERPIIVGRELTKVHQTLYRGTAAEVLAGGIDPRGEFTVMLGPRETRPEVAVYPGDAQIANEFGAITELSPSLGRKDAIKVVAERYGIPSRQVYAVVERLKR